MSWNDGKRGGGCNPGGNRPGGFHPGGPRSEGSHFGGPHFGGPHPRGLRPGGFHPGGPHLGGPCPGGFHPGGPHPGGFHPGGPRPRGFYPGGPRPGGFRPGPGGPFPAPGGPYPGPGGPCPEIVPETPLKPAKKLGAKGGDEGDIWDDGVFDGVRKVHVGQYQDGVSFVKIEYNKGSQVIIGDGHGKQSMLEPETFELDYPSEYIIALKGKYDTFHQEKGGGMTWLTTLTFVTNKRTSNPYGLDAGKSFEIKEEGHKIVGFHGKASDYVHQIGVYVVPITN